MSHFLYLYFPICSKEMPLFYILLFRNLMFFFINSIHFLYAFAYVPFK